MQYFIVIHSDDFSKIKKFNIKLPIAILNSADGVRTISLDGAMLPDFRVYPGLLLCIALTPKARQDLTEFAEDIAQRFSCDPPAVSDLSKVDTKLAELHIQAEIISALTLDVKKQAMRNVELMRALVAVRDTYARMQTSFSQLEGFVFSNNLAQRTNHLSLLPTRQHGTIVLTNEADIEQRLPVASSGISDVSIFIDKIKRPENGTLTVRLWTVEDDVTHAVWHVTGDALSVGEVRLSLPVALALEQFTPVLSITWDGDGDIELPTALFHPDPRFQAHLSGEPDGRVLACVLRSYIAGCEAPIPSGAFLPSGILERSKSVRILSLDALSKVVDLTPENKGFGIVPETNALQVHPAVGSISVALAPAVIPVGATEVQARIVTRAEQAPDIEYAMAIAPVHARPKPGENIPDFAPELVAGWTRLKALESGDLLLPLETPIDTPYDLYMMTRLPESVASASWSWATFDQIKISIE